MVDIIDAIIDATRMEGLSVQAVRMWQTIVQAADAVGLARVEIRAGAGSGHKSHLHGTEIDFIAYNADGTTWTAQQRVALAYAAAAGGARRFGFYSRSDRPVSIMHVGLGYEGSPMNVAWGPNGRTSGVAISNFAPEERAFVAALRSGQVETFLQSPEVMAFQPETPPAQAEAQVAIDRVFSTIPSIGVLVGRGGLLERGSDRHSEVMELQRFLNDEGFADNDGRGLLEDGVFGPSTEQALRNYQRAREITVDGTVGPETFRVMQSDVVGVPPEQLPAFTVRPEPAIPPPAVGQMTEAGMLRRGASGDAVTELQRFLNFHGYTGRDGAALREDGQYGRNTAYAVQAYQRASGLADDGVVGPNTLGAMQVVGQAQALAPMAQDLWQFYDTYRRPNVPAWMRAGGYDTPPAGTPITLGSFARLADLDAMTPRETRIYSQQIELRRRQMEAAALLYPGNRAAINAEQPIRNTNEFAGLSWVEFQRLDVGAMNQADANAYNADLQRRTNEFRARAGMAPLETKMLDRMSKTAPRTLTLDVKASLPEEGDDEHSWLRRVVSRRTRVPEDDLPDDTTGLWSAMGDDDQRRGVRAVWPMPERRPRHRSTPMERVVRRGPLASKPKAMV